jgi:hypothetical protein
MDINKQIYNSDGYLLFYISDPVSVVNDLIRVDSLEGANSCCVRSQLVCYVVSLL